MAVDIAQLLAFAVKNKASDLHLSSGVPPMIRVDGDMKRINMPPLTHKEVHSMVYDIMNDKQRKAYEEFYETDFSFEIPKLARFRVNAFNQNRGAAAVFRNIPSVVLSLDDLNAPKIFKDIAMQPRGLVLVTGPTGSGKSTTLAAMINYVNDNRPDHIITIEDPIEYVHTHKNCVVTQREVGVDTDSWHMALKNTLRQAPDVILVGEIRDRETMEYGIQFAETGHLVLATLHANSANQAMDRIINFFPEDRREQLLMDLSLNIRAMIAQRLIPREAGKGRIAAMEVMLNTPLISDLIFRGEVSAIKEIMAKSNRLGMKTFDQALYELFEVGVISYEEALRNADSKNEIRLRIKLESKRNDKGTLEESGALKIMEEEE